MLDQRNKDEVARFFDQNLPKEGTARIVTFGTTKNRLLCEYCDEVKQLAEEVAEASRGRLTAEHHLIEEEPELVKRLRVRRAPATVVVGAQDDLALKFYGLPSGYEFVAVLSDIVDAVTGSTALAPETVQALKDVSAPVHIQVFVTPTCPYCPRAVRTAHQFSLVNPKMIDAEMVESMEFPELADQYAVMAVPKVVVNDRVMFEGALPEEEFLSRVMEAVKS